MWISQKNGTSLRKGINGAGTELTSLRSRENLWKTCRQSFVQPGEYKRTRKEERTLGERRYAHKLGLVWWWKSWRARLERMTQWNTFYCCNRCRSSRDFTLPIVSRYISWRCIALDPLSLDLLSNRVVPCLEGTSKEGEDRSKVARICTIRPDHLLLFSVWHSTF